MIRSAARSFFENPGFRYSSLMRIRPLIADVIRDKSTSGVLPMEPITESWRVSLDVIAMLPVAQVRCECLTVARILHHLA